MFYYKSVVLVTYTNSSNLICFNFLWFNWNLIRILELNSDCDFFFRLYYKHIHIQLTLKQNGQVDE